METERRLNALKADLEQAQQNRVEKTMAVRYHKVSRTSPIHWVCIYWICSSRSPSGQILWWDPFPLTLVYETDMLLPERQKAVRRISKTKRQLQDDSIDSKAKRKLEKTLLSHRVDLNYILVGFPRFIRRVGWSIAQSSTYNFFFPAFPQSPQICVIIPPCHQLSERRARYRRRA